MVTAYEPPQPRWFSVVANPGTVIFMVRGDVTMAHLEDSLKERGFKHIHSSQEMAHLMSIREWGELKFHNRIIKPKEVAHEA